MTNEELILARLDRIEMMQAVAVKSVLNAKEAALYLGITTNALHIRTHNGQITYYKPTSGKTYFKKKDLDEYLLSNKIDKYKFN